MVKNEFDTRRLELELSYPALKLDVRVNVEIRDHEGRYRHDVGDRVVSQAISETLQLHADFFRFEVADGLPKNKSQRDAAFDILSAAIEGVCFSERWQEHNWDQLDLFDQAEHGPVHNLMSHGLLESPSTDGDESTLRCVEVYDSLSGKPATEAQLKLLRKLD